jgi:hypothetical protein
MWVLTSIVLPWLVNVLLDTSMLDAMANNMSRTERTMGVRAWRGLGFEVERRRCGRLRRQPHC